MAEIARAYIQLVPSAKGFKSSIASEINPSQLGSEMGGELSKGLGGKFKAALGALGIGAAIGKTFSSAFEEGSQLEQSIGGIETLFKKSSDKMIAQANQSWKTAGMSANSYMQLATSFSASLLQSLEGDTEKATKATDMAIIDMSDNANKMGSNMEDITNAYQGFAKQNYTMLDNLKLGYGGTKEEMQRLLADAEKVTGIKYDINNLNDVYSAIHVIQGELGITGTTAKEATATLEGSINSLKASWQDLLGKMLIGEDFSGAMLSVATAATNVLQNVFPAVSNFIVGLMPAISGALAELAPQLLPMLVEFLVSTIQGLADSIPVVFENIMGIMEGIVQGLLLSIPILITAIPPMIEAFVNGLLGAIPQIINAGVMLLTSLIINLPLIITTLAEAMPLIVTSLANAITQNIPLIVNAGVTLLVALVKNLPLIIASVIKAAPKIVRSLALTFKANISSIASVGFTLLTSLISKLPSAIATIVKAVPRVIRSLMSAFRSKLGSFAEIGKNLISSIGKGITGAITGLVDKSIKACKKLKQSVKDFFGIKSPSKVFREFGAFLMEGMAIGIEKTVDMPVKSMDKANERIKRIIGNDLAREVALSGNYGVVDKTRFAVNQTFNFNQPFKSPADTARALRHESLKLGLAGGINVL